MGHDRDVSLSPGDASTTDAEALIARVETLQDTQRREDVEGFLALFAAPAVWVTGSGRRLIGRDAIADFTRAVLPGGMGDGSVTYEVEHILFVGADVALTAVRQQYLGAEGEPVPDSAGLPTYLWRRDGGTWLIVAGQNTAAAAP
jgi:uncharacterized protein (TIGR02246 family)